MMANKQCGNFSGQLSRILATRQISMYSMSPFHIYYTTHVLLCTAMYNYIIVGQFVEGFVRVRDVVWLW